MKSWDVATLEGFPGPPRILSTTDETRVVALGLAAGEELSEHQVHERAWLAVITGEAAVADAAGETVVAGPGTLFEFAPRERHSVRARTETRLVLLLAPWPGEGHPGAMALEQKKESAQAPGAETVADGVGADTP